MCSCKSLPGLWVDFFLAPFWSHVGNALVTGPSSSAPQAALSATSTFSHQLQGEASGKPGSWAAWHFKEGDFHS